MADAEYVSHIDALVAREVAIARRMERLSRNAGALLVAPAITAFIAIWFGLAEAGMVSAAAFIAGATIGWVGFGATREAIERQADKAASHRWAVINALRAHAKQ